MASCGLHTTYCACRTQVQITIIIILLFSPRKVGWLGQPRPKDLRQQMTVTRCEGSEAGPGSIHSERLFPQTGETQCMLGLDFVVG